MSSRLRSQAGSLTPAVAILAVMIFWLAGLVIDGSRQLSARSRAIAYAQEAARAGASGIDLNLRDVKFDPEEVATRVDRYCAQVRANDTTVTQCRLAKPPTDEDLEVYVELNNPTTFLRMLSIENLTAKGTGEAHAEQGITRADETPTIPSISLLPTEQSFTEDPHETASTPTLDPPCTPRPETTTITTTTEEPTPPPPADPTATVTSTITVVTTTPGLLPPICTPSLPTVPN
jgi:hypothetical protein